MGIGSLTTAALTLGAEFDLRNVLEGKWPSSSVSIALAAILLYGSQRQHLQARKGLFRSSASARARLPVVICVWDRREMHAGHQESVLIRNRTSTLIINCSGYKPEIGCFNCIGSNSRARLSLKTRTNKQTKQKKKKKKVQ